MASEYLRKNTSNRRVRRASVERLIAAIKSGQWEVTHQGIAIGEDGKLIDGQHRLLAIVESGVAVKLLVSTDVPNSSSRYIDIHTKRDLADRFRFVDDYNVNKRACSIVSAYFQHALGEVKLVNNMERVETFFIEHSDEILWAARSSVGHKTYFGRSDVGAALMGYYRHNPEGADVFNKNLSTGASLDAGHPALALRNFFMQGAYIASNSRDPSVYWKTVRATQLFESGEDCGGRVWQASEDWFGNKNTYANKKNSERAQKAAITRWGKKKSIPV